ncbi:hypothetical protein SASPL_107236 [Salvia splendens]|uniref:3-hydroxyacyl-CoA dehydrogenase NAD binding domain-containing protein n=1 Tax=Salvia splendens TaxID=180675 RepID=A0A8X9A547_SALSN|nr:hypothetical protein SASPL_107236 [Salvia splendens]
MRQTRNLFTTQVNYSTTFLLIAGATTMLAKTLVEVGSDGVAVVSINNPPLNLLSAEVMVSIKESIERVLSRDDVKAIVITGTNRKFSGGSDVTVFGGKQEKKSKIDSVPKEELGFLSINFITDTLEAANKPIVAAIDGLALGGAMEIVLACHTRISTSSAILGLTELQYGVVPGLEVLQVLIVHVLFDSLPYASFGNKVPLMNTKASTACGPSKGFGNDVGMNFFSLLSWCSSPPEFQLVLCKWFKFFGMYQMSKRVDGKEARILSLVDAIAPADKLLEVARRWALDIVEHTKPWVISLYKTDKLGTLEEARAILNSARMEVHRQNPNVEHPLVCIDLIEQGVVSDPRDALWTETIALHELRQSSTCKSLVHFSLLSAKPQRIPLILSSLLPPCLLDAYWFQIYEMNLLPKIIDKVAVIGGGLMSSEIVALLLLKNYQVILKEQNREHLLEDMNKIRNNLYTHFKYGKTTQQGLEKALTLLKGVLDYDSVEDVDLVIEAECETLSTKQDIFTDLEKHCPPNCIFASTSSTFSLGLVGERTKCQDRIVGIHFFCLSPVMPLMEIVLTERVSSQAMADVLGFARKFRTTPIVVSDCNGQGVNSMVVTYLHASMLLAELGVDVCQIDQALKSFGMDLGPFRMIDMNANREGESTCKGFYKYDDCGKAIPDPELRKYTIKATSEQLTKLSDTEIAEMILFPAYNEACRVISEGVVMRPSDLDVASVLAMGFPSYRGGIHYWANNIDSGYVYSKLKKWSEAYGGFFEPCDYITERAGKSTPVAKQVKSQM